MRILLQYMRNYFFALELCSFQYLKTYDFFCFNFFILIF